MPQSRLKRWVFDLLILYSALLFISTVVRYRWLGESITREKMVDVRSVARGSITGQTVSIAYEEFRPAQSQQTLPVLLLHGSPGRGSEFERLIPLLSGMRRVIAPDLPGFGGSTHSVPDYSIEAHSLYILQLLDALRIDRVHVIGFSMGGGVALNLAERAPERIASVTMIKHLKKLPIHLELETRIKFGRIS